MVWGCSKWGQEEENRRLSDGKMGNSSSQTALELPSASLLLSRVTQMPSHACVSVRTGAGLPLLTKVQTLWSSYGMPFLGEPPCKLSVSFIGTTLFNIPFQQTPSCLHILPGAHGGFSTQDPCAHHLRQPCRRWDLRYCHLPGCKVFGYHQCWHGAGEDISSLCFLFQGFSCGSVEIFLAKPLGDRLGLH